MKFKNLTQTSRKGKIIFGSNIIENIAVRLRLAEGYDVDFTADRKGAAALEGGAVQGNADKGVDVAVGGNGDDPAFGGADRDGPHDPKCQQQYPDGQPERPPSVFSADSSFCRIFARLAHTQSSFLGQDLVSVMVWLPSAPTGLHTGSGGR